jgi:hypothetical protein
MSEHVRVTNGPFESADLERIQRLVARTIATHPAGHNLLLIGGFRYRLLDQSARLSLDIDYHWAGDLPAKQEELVALCRRRILPLVRRQLGYQGVARAATGPGTDSVAARLVDLAFGKPDVAMSRIEIPLEVTRVQHVDPVTVRTSGGVVYPTLTEADLIEAKAIAVVNRVHLAHRDLVDLFLFGDCFLSDSAVRLRAKLAALSIDPTQVTGRLEDLRQNLQYHARATQAVLDGQLNSVGAANVNAAGGGETVVRQALEHLETNFRIS